MKKRKIFYLFIVILCIMCITMSTFSATYLYKVENVDKSKVNKESSISTIQTAATPEFNFQSTAQILIEPYSRTVIYENNADEHLLPASVTKVMTS